MRTSACVVFVVCLGFSGIATAMSAGGGGAAAGGGGGAPPVVEAELAVV
jgi:hypothetical protein